MERAASSMMWLERITAPPSLLAGPCLACCAVVKCARLREH